VKRNLFYAYSVPCRVSAFDFRRDDELAVNLDSGFDSWAAKDFLEKRAERGGAEE
jgi:hypothetical protein